MEWQLQPSSKEFRFMHLVYIALGSNLGNRSGNLIAAIQYLGPEVRVKKCSAVYETPPWGYEDQPKFLNQVLEVETDLAPGDLLDHVKKIESDVGREVSFRYGPRSIDIDILFFDDLVIDSPPLCIPHARIPERAFVLVPLADIAPNYQHPALDMTVESLLGMVDQKGIQFFSSGGCPGENE
jgi:2-amino-4-hydroxy-6-hydroxymethyldihydropteridine diphosphokinase